MPAQVTPPAHAVNPPSAPTAPATIGVGILAPIVSKNPYMPRLVEALRREGIRVVGCGMGTFFLHRFLGRSAPKIAHFHWIQPQIMTEGNRIKTRLKFIAFMAQLKLLPVLGVTTVWTAHDLRDHDSRESRLDSRATIAVARQAAGIIAHCPTARQTLLQRLPKLNPQRIAVVPHGNYDLDHNFTLPRSSARAELGLDPEAIILLFFGNIRAYKGITDLIEAFRADRRENIHLIIAGRPFRDSDGRAVQDAIAGDRRITFESGFIDPARLDNLIAACDLMALPYRNILSSGAALMAMTFGRAVLCPRIGCFNDLFDESGAFMYEADDEDGLAAALEAALDERHRLDAMGLRNRQEAADVPWSRSAQLTAAVYRRAVRRQAVDTLE